MKIKNDLYVVASGATGFAISNAYDCTVYLIDGGNNHLALIDSGAGIEANGLINGIKNVGFDPSHVQAVFLTHGHADHSAGAHMLQERYGTTVYASATTASIFKTGDWRNIGLPQAIDAGVYPKWYEFTPPVITALADNTSVQIGRHRLVFHETPGHCDGHACYIWECDEKCHLFSGDLIFAGGRILLQCLEDCRIIDYANSIKRMRTLEANGIFPGHGNFLLEGAKLWLDSASDAFDRLVVPQNFL